MTLAICIYAFWPSSPLISVKNEDVVGFDESRELFYSTSYRETEQRVNAYDLKTGNLVSSIAMKNPSSGNDFLPLVLTRDGRFIIRISDALGVFPAVRLPILENISNEKVLNGTIRAYGFSVDGKLLLLQDLESQDDKETITIWDIEENQPFDRVVLPQKPVMLFWSASNHLPSHSLDLTKDRRYLAANLIDGSFVVYDRMERTVVLRLNDIHVIPRFTSNGMLVLLPTANHGEDQSIRWYRLTEGQWRFQREAFLKLSKGETITQIVDQFLVTEQIENNTPEWLGKSPGHIQDLIAKIMLRYSMTLRFWDLETGDLTRTVKQNFPGSANQKLPGFWLSTSNGFCSNSGRYVALMQPVSHSLLVWTRSPIRPLLCWLIAVGVLILAMGIGWQRRVSSH